MYTRICTFLTNLLALNVLDFLSKTFLTLLILLSFLQYRDCSFLFWEWWKIVFMKLVRQFFLCGVVLLLICYLLRLGVLPKFNAVMSRCDDLTFFLLVSLLFEVCWCHRKDDGVVILRCFLSVCFTGDHSCCSKQIWFCPAYNSESSLLWPA